MIQPVQITYVETAGSKPSKVWADKQSVVPAKQSSRTLTVYRKLTQEGSDVPVELIVLWDAEIVSEKPALLSKKLGVMKLKRRAK